MKPARCTWPVIMAALMLPPGWCAASATDGNCKPPEGTQPFEFVDGNKVLRGFIDFPKGPGPHAALLILHGSGNTDVFHGSGLYYGNYQRLRDTFRMAGLATVVWDKAGNGCSTGSYARGIPLRERAHEVTLALRALEQRQDIDAGRMGLWAFSQGGWIAPMVAVQTNVVSFLVMVGAPVRDVLSLTEYQSLSALRAQGVGGLELETAAFHLRRALAIMRAGGPIESYVDAVAPLKRYPVLRELGVTEGTPEAYRFWQDQVDFHYRPDTALRELRQPILAIYGDRDDRVDWRDGVQIYRESLERAHNRDFTIKVFKNANHELMRIGPDAQPVDGYLHTMQQWLARHAAPAAASNLH